METNSLIEKNIR